jgi:hypothetical protein
VSEISFVAGLTRKAGDTEKMPLTVGCLNQGVIVDIASELLRFEKRLPFTADIWNFHILFIPFKIRA